MSRKQKKALWSCYVITLLLCGAILFWGFHSSGRFLGSGRAFRVLAFYVMIPGATFLLGLALGSKNARLKWLYPFFSAALAYLILLTLTRFREMGNPLHFIVPFLSASIGIGIGMWIWNLSVKSKGKLKKLAKYAILLGFLVALIHIAHGLTLDDIMEYKEVTFSSPDVPQELDGYRIAFVVDTHFISEERLWGVVEELNQRDLDLLLLGGDFAANTAWMRTSVAILSHIETRDGIFGVEGNHDNHRFLFQAMEEQGMTPLSNSGLHIRENFFLAGVEDLWNRSPSIAAAIAGAEPDDFVLLLSHNPDVAMQQDTTGVHLILSGHTHGGQITFFGLWAPYFTVSDHITSYGQRFRSGWAESHDGTPVFVSNGTGEYLPRIFARPQVILLTLSHEG